MTYPAKRFVAGIAALMIFGFPALAEDYIKTADSSLGPILTDERGMTLYTFDNDTGGVSVCVDDCAVNWPPLLADADDGPEGDYGVIVRPDGARQWTFKGMPLYTWVKDTAPGDVTGDGVKGVWHVAKP